MPNPVTIRPRRSYWFLMIAFSLIPPLIIVLSTGSNDSFQDHLSLASRLWCGGLLFSILISFPVGAIVWSYLAFIRLDTERVTWRKCLRTYSFRWDDVEDYYLSGSGSGYCYGTIVFASGTLSLRSMMWDLDVLKEYVVLRALKARTTQWQEFGTRPDVDWPLTLDYKTQDNWLCLEVVYRIACITPILFLPYVAYNLIHGYATDLPDDFPFHLAASLVLLLVVLVPCAVYVYIAREIKSRQKETITVDSEAITLENGHTTVRASWQELRYLNPGGLSRKSVATGSLYYLSSPHGPISFTPRMNRYWVLERIIESQTAASTKS